LMCAVLNFNPMAVNYVLEAGADIDRETTAGNLGSGLTALMWAADCGLEECARLQGRRGCC